MIPNLFTEAQQFGLTAPYLSLVFAALFTGFVLLMQAITRWFEERNA